MLFFCTGIDCRTPYPVEEMKARILKDDLELQDVPRCERCAGLAKPDIVFFGENLPERFFTGVKPDFGDCDLLIVMGTSLTVAPFASLPEFVPDHVPRVLINRDRVGGHIFAWGDKDNSRDVFVEGSCDDGVTTLARLLGWEQDLLDIQESFVKK